MKIYLVDVNEIDGDWEESEKTDDEFITEAEKQGTVYTLRGFEQTFNGESDFISNVFSFIRY